ncbi:MAG: phospholipid carrier-dependent glycosyltransferase [Desulfuromonadales bacterium]
MQTDFTTRTTFLTLALLTLFVLFMNAFQLSSQPVSEDDYYVALSAINYMESGQLGPTMWNHPCLRNILVYYALRMFGTGVLGAKGVSLLLGTLCTPLIGLVAKRIFNDNLVALIAAFLWACDALVIDFSRQGINDIYLAFFPLAAIYLVYRYRESGNQSWLIASGIFFGCGLASKWSALFPMLVTFTLLIVAIHKETGGAVRERIIRFCHAAVLLLLVPALVYLLTFIPWFGRGYSLPEWSALQKSMFLETSQHVGYKPKEWDDRDNKAYKWFVMPSVFVDPFMNMDTLDGETKGVPDFDKSVTVVLGYANPLVWLLVLPAIFLVARRAIRERDEGAGYLTGLFLMSYLPLVLSPRPIWMNTALSVLPYAIMAVAFFVRSAAERFRQSRRIIAVYLTLVLIVASPLYLLAIGKGTRIPVLRAYLAEQYLVQFKKNMPPGDVKDAPKSAIPTPAQPQ